jgi:hypothetical protein
LEARYLLRLVTEEGEGGEGDAQLDQGAGGGDGGGAFSAAVRAHCLRQSIAIEAYAPDGGQGGSRHMRYRTLEAETMFHENIFNVESWYMYLLQFTCCVWVTTHVYFVDLKNVCNLLEFRDFNRWLLPLKGEQLPQNTWVLLIPAMQLLLCTAVASVSCCITCGFTDAVDIVLNSLAFTFIAKVAYTHARARARARAHTHMPTCTHAHMHTCTHAHMHMHPLTPSYTPYIPYARWPSSSTSRYSTPTRNLPSMAWAPSMALHPSTIWWASTTRPTRTGQATITGSTAGTSASRTATPGY